MSADIVHIPSQHRFELHVEGLTAFVEYEIDNGHLDIVHTLVPPALEGRGIAAELVKTTFDYALDQGLRPHGSCSYAAVWLKRHPEYSAGI